MAVHIRSSGINRFIKEDVKDFMIRLGKVVQKKAEGLAPTDTGKLKRSIDVSRVTFRGDKVSVKVSTNTGYGLYPEQGTGIYGPRGQVIRPKKAQFLVFKPKGLGHVIRVRSVRGQRGQHYMRDALIAVIRKL